jgi:hypothetical protein
MANTLSLGSGNWGAKESLLLGYYEDGGKFFPETFDVTRATPATRVDKDGLIVTDTEILSGELVTNGDFATDSDWTKQANWSIGFGKANSNGTGLIYQTAVSYVDGKTYKVTFNANITSGSGTVRLGNTSTSTAFVNGLNEFYLQTDVSNTTKYIFFQGNSFIGSIDNVSVIEVNRNNFARIDYSDSTKGVLLTEPESTNLITYSQDISNASWLKQNSGIASIPNVTANYAISPDGTKNASRIVFDLNEGTTNSDFSQLQSEFTGTSGAIYTSSVYIKSNNNNNYNVTVVGVNGGTNERVVTKNWQRFEITATLSSSNFRMRTRPTENSSDVTDILIWGAQVENQSFATSIIPTNRSAITRNQDLVTNGGEVSAFNSEEGVLFAEMAALSDDLSIRYISLSDGSIANEIYLRYDNVSNRIVTTLTVGGAPSASFISTAYDITNLNKIAFKYKENDFSLWINGVKIAEDTSGSTFPIDTLNSLSFYRSNATGPFFGKTSQVQVFKKALTDAELIKLTTI